MTIIDAHQHVWNPGRARYDWLGPDMTPIDRTMTFDDVRSALRRSGVDATVLVQSADNDDDTDLILETAALTPEIAAVVVYLPLDDPQRAHDRLSQLRVDPHVVGVRSLIHNRSDPDWIIRPEVDAGLSLLEEADVSFDYVAVLPRHLEHVRTISERHPKLRIVIDHLAKPPVGAPGRQPWWDLIATAAENPRVFAKVSGLYSSVGAMADWTTDDVRPLFERAVEVFGADRLMYGGDWPISVLAGGYDRVWEGLQLLFAELDVAARSAILGETAQQFYRIDPRLLDAALAKSAE
ncbi:amidohydrolase family protein [Glaciihabitans sp. UYNi722]|uniref:amidohydrolase family protein n=1 Tax=Glaciihabitans sp. UYNi722 TaxID=3156344 RepID=UPI00339B6C60